MRGRGWAASTPAERRASRSTSATTTATTRRRLNGAGVGGRIYPTTNSALSNDGTEKDDTNTVVGQLTSVLGSNLLFEARGQYSREKRPRLANSEIADVQQHGRHVRRRATSCPRRRSTGACRPRRTDLRRRAATPPRPASNTTTSFAEQMFGFNQFGAIHRQRCRDAVLELMTLGGHDREPVRVPRTGAESPSPTTADRQPGAGLRDGRNRVLRAGRWRSSRTSRSTTACAGKVRSIRRRTPTTSSC